MTATAFHIEGLADRLQLTAKEVEVLECVARGLSNQEVASDLFVAVETVKFHLGSIYRKTSARNRVEAARWFWEMLPVALPDEVVFYGVTYRRVDA